MKLVKLLLTAIIFLFTLFSLSAQSSLPQHDTQVVAAGSADNIAQNNTSQIKQPEVVTINKRFAYGIGIDMITMLLIFGLIYFPNYRNKEFMFTFFLFNIIIFIITFVLNKTNISMGAAFGLFAVFSMLRYRTEGISMKEMTYLLIAIALGLINAIGLSLVPILVFNAIFIAFIFVLDHPVVFKQEHSKTVIYENIEYIKPENSGLLMTDLRERTGLNIHRYSINSFDFLKDATYITVYYYKQRKEVS